MSSWFDEEEEGIHQVFICLVQGCKMYRYIVQRDWKASIVYKLPVHVRTSLAVKAAST